MLSYSNPPHGLIISTFGRTNQFGCFSPACQNKLVVLMPRDQIEIAFVYKQVQSLHSSYLAFIVKQ